MSNRVMREILKTERPFLHFIITNFLNDNDLKNLSKCYSELEFHLKHTDLYEFYQTTELKNDPKFLFFSDCLLNIAEELGLDVSEELDMFASYYAKNNYLLAHDDLISSRKYAYSFYLEDFDSGELNLFNNTCDHLEKSIKIKKNTLVIFEVSKDSWHEVAPCTDDGRRAFTGWFHFNDSAEIEHRYGSPIRNRKKNICSNPQIEKLDFPLEKDIVSIDNINMNIIDEPIKELGPFCDRRIMLIKGSNVIFEIPGLTFVEKESFHIRINDYILLNDEINDEKPYEYFTIFCFNSSSSFNTSVIKFVDSDGNIEFELCPELNTIYAIKGNIWKWYIERSKSEILFEYLIYKV